MSASIQSDMVVVLLSEFSAHDNVCVVNGGTAIWLHVEYYCLPVNEMEVDSQQPECGCKAKLYVLSCCMLHTRIDVSVDKSF